MGSINCRGENSAINHHGVLDRYLLEVSACSNMQTVEVHDKQGVVCKRLAPHIWERTKHYAASPEPQMSKYCGDDDSFL